MFPCQTPQISLRLQTRGRRSTFPKSHDCFQHFSFLPPSAMRPKKRTIFIHPYSSKRPTGQQNSTTSNFTSSSVPSFHSAPRRDHAQADIRKVGTSHELPPPQAVFPATSQLLSTAPSPTLRAHFTVHHLASQHLHCMTWTTSGLVSEESTYYWKTPTSGVYNQNIQSRPMSNENRPTSHHAQQGWAKTRQEQRSGSVHAYKSLIHLRKQIGAVPL